MLRTRAAGAAVSSPDNPGFLLIALGRHHLVMPVTDPRLRSPRRPIAALSPGPLPKLAVLLFSGIEAGVDRHRRIEVEAVEAAIAVIVMGWQRCSTQT